MFCILKQEDLQQCRSDNKIIVYYAAWDVFVKKTFRLISKIEQEFDVTFLGVDVDHFKSLCTVEYIKAVPTFCFFKNDYEKDRVVGLPLTSAFRAKIRENFFKT